MDGLNITICSPKVLRCDRCNISEFNTKVIYRQYVHSTLCELCHQVTKYKVRVKANGYERYHEYNGAENGKAI